VVGYPGGGWVANRLQKKRLAAEGRGEDVTDEGDTEVDGDDVLVVLMEKEGGDGGGELEATLQQARRLSLYAVLEAVARLPLFCF